jgi:hypothetical protein
VNRRFKKFIKDLACKNAELKIKFILKEQNLNKLGSTKCTNNN